MGALSAVRAVSAVSAITTAGLCGALISAALLIWQVLVEVLLQRHSDLCKTLGVAKVSQPNEAEQRECIGRLCSSKILAATETYGSIRLVVQPEDVRVMAREQALVKHLFQS